MKKNPMGDNNRGAPRENDAAKTRVAVIPQKPYYEVYVKYVDPLPNLGYMFAGNKKK